ncbi:MAG TPA: phage tail sheath subtilisin-like domain-containing protein [Pyrinomonadaceae bacterium]|jgi:hypothetical protein|nr:phage tail sheath subtilisin-like domain-containing protein [Pyrinomonadaceae bacterium]
MQFDYHVPGIYKQDIVITPETQLPTGLPGFVGFAEARKGTGIVPNTPVALHRKDDFNTAFINGPSSYLADAVAGFFSNGGSRCYVVCADTGAPDRVAALLAALEALAPLDDLDLVAIPDAMSLNIEITNSMHNTVTSSTPDTASILEVQRQLLKHCQTHGNRFAILDPIRGSSVALIMDQRNSITGDVTEPVSGALYYPWLMTEKGRFVPPCGHVAGIYARSDKRTGVHKAPANEEIEGGLDLEVKIDNSIQDQLNPVGINCLRSFPGRGIRVWGARTLSRDPQWRYINVRRLFITLHRWVDHNMAWANFEPNTPELWIRIQRELSLYLTGLWQAGALSGATTEEAFYIKCDAETNPQDIREAGETVTEVGLAPLSPAEFIVIRIIQRVGTTRTS